MRLTTPIKANNVIPKKERGDVWMKGGIYSDQRCPVCGARFRDNFKNTLQCPEHPGQKASRFRVYFRGVTKRFESYKAASRYLTGLRFKTDEGTFDARDYKRDNPLAFDRKAREWVEIKKGQLEAGDLKRSSFLNIQEHMNKAISYWGDKVVHTFQGKDFSKWLNDLRPAANRVEKLTTKSKFNHLQTVKQFFSWLEMNGDIDKMLAFPEYEYDLAWRTTLETKQQQLEVLGELEKIAPRKIWFGIKLLITYFKQRPGELRSIKEKDIDLKNGLLIIHRHKTRKKVKKPKIVPLIPEDLDIFKSFPRAIDKEMCFFRHEDGSQFGKRRFYTWWKRACKNLGIEGVDLYGGTRHTTVRELKKSRKWTKEQIKEASDDHTNRAFERYYGDDVIPEHQRGIFEAASGKEVAKEFDQSRKSK